MGYKDKVAIKILKKSFLKSKREFNKDKNMETIGTIRELNDKDKGILYDNICNFEYQFIIFYRKALSNTKPIYLYYLDINFN